MRWRGRILLVALALYLLERLGVPIPTSGLVRVVLFGYGAWGLWRLGRAVLRRLLWRIRMKLLLSYLFIAVVPVVLLGLFFMLAGLLFSGLVGGHLVSSEIERTGQALEGVAHTTLAALAFDEPALPATLTRRLEPARAIHPKLACALVRRGRVLASSGDAPKELPSWWKGPGFSGVVRGANGAHVRAVWAEGDAFLVLDVPIDAELFAPLAQRTGIHLVSLLGRGESGDIEIGVREEPERRGESRPADGGLNFPVPVDQTDWTTGEQDARPLLLLFRFGPIELLQSLSPGSLKGDKIVTALMVVGVIFLLMYGVALLFGFLLARSITKKVHALSVGTEKLRQGDFAHRIPVFGRDQLSDLAESFNLMSRGIEGLLLEQAEKQRLEEELRIARQIQMSLLPPEGAIGMPGLRIAALCLPAAEVGGDYYDLLPLSDTRLGVLVADVSGKGTSAALYMAELKGLVLSLSRMYASPAKLLSEANRILAATMDPRSFVTMTYAVVDTGARTMRYARAGHNPIIQRETATGATCVLTPPGLGLGMDPGERFDAILEEAEVPLRSGDVFLFFTDGLSEAMNVEAEIFGERRLRDVVEQVQDGDEAALKDRILREIRGFVGDAAQHDDMTMVILKVV